MKRTLTCLLFTTLMLTACTASQPSSTVSDESPNSKDEENSELVSVIYPAFWFEQYTSVSKESFAAGRRATSMDINEDGSVTLWYTEEHLAKKVENAADVTGDVLWYYSIYEKTPYIQEVTHDGSYRLITVLVNSEYKQEDFAQIAYDISSFALICQINSGAEPVIQVDFVLESDKQLLASIEMPNADIARQLKG